MGAKLSGEGPDGEDDLIPFAEINVTPFVDVMLVLLIIFMVTAPLMLAGVQVDMPKASAARQNPPQNPLVVTLAPDNRLYIRNEEVAPTGLTSRLTDIQKAEGDRIVFVKADKSLAYGVVMELLGDIAASGFTKISLLSERKPGS